MENFGTRKTKDIILMSGVACTISALLGKHAALISVLDEKKRDKGFEELLRDCIESIGNKTKASLNDNDIKRMLMLDRKQILFEVRKLSNQRQPDFIFDYEFPVQNGMRHKQRIVIKLDKQNFPYRPFKWVYNQMVQIYCQKNNCKEENTVEFEQKVVTLMELPVVYESYAQMLEENEVQKFHLLDADVECNFKLLTHERAKRKMATVVEENANTLLLIHEPTYMMKGENKDTEAPLPYDQMSLEDVEGLRGEILKVHGYIETAAVIQNDKNSEMVQQIELTQIAAFFFPSLSQ